MYETLEKWQLRGTRSGVCCLAENKASTFHCLITKILQENPAELFIILIHYLKVSEITRTFLIQLIISNSIKHEND